MKDSSSDKKDIKEVIERLNRKATREDFEDFLSFDNNLRKLYMAEYTLLIKAAQLGDLKIFKKLVRDLNFIAPEEALIAAMIALSNDKVDVVKYLLRENYLNAFYSKKEFLKLINLAKNKGFKDLAALLMSYLDPKVEYKASDFQELHKSLEILEKRLISLKKTKTKFKNLNSRIRNLSQHLKKLKRIQKEIDFEKKNEETSSINKEEIVKEILKNSDKLDISKLILASESLDLMSLLKKIANELDLEIKIDIRIQNQKIKEREAETELEDSEIIPARELKDYFDYEEYKIIVESRIDKLDDLFKKFSADFRFDPYDLGESYFGWSGAEGAEELEERQEYLGLHNTMHIATHILSSVQPKYLNECIEKFKKAGLDLNKIKNEVLLYSPPHSFRILIDHSLVPDVDKLKKLFKYLDEVYSTSIEEDVYDENIDNRDETYAFKSENMYNRDEIYAFKKLLKRILREDKNFRLNHNPFLKEYLKEAKKELMKNKKIR